MKISEVIRELNDALNKYGDIPVTMSIPNQYEDAEVEDIQADEESVTLYDFL